MSSTRSLISTLAGFAALGFTVIAIAYWALFANPPLSLDWPLRILLVLAILSASIYLLAAPEAVGRVASKRSTRLTANALVASLVAIAIAILLNAIVETLPLPRADLTSAKTFTLSEQSLKVVQELKKPVTAVAIYSGSQSAASRTQIEDQLKAYEAHTSNLKTQFVDADRDLATARTYGITRLPAVVFDNGQKRETSYSVTEADFTGALVRLQQTAVKSVAFLTGHGERSTEDFDRTGYSTVKDTLVKDNYQVVNWSLITSPTLTLSNTTVLVIAAPTKPLAPNELQSVQKYLGGGGHVMLLLDPNMPDDALSSMTTLVSKYGLTPVKGDTIDTKLNYQSPDYVVVTRYQDSEITRDLNRDQLPTLFPSAMAVKPPTSTVEALTVNAFLQTTVGAESSWLETNQASLQDGTAKFDEGKDVAGPVPIGLSVGPADVSASSTQTPTVGTRLVVFGDADFATNLFLTGLPVNTANLDLFANSVSWLAEQTNLVSIRPKDPEAPRTVTLTSQQQWVMFASTVVGLPLLVLLLGGLIWWRRR